MAARLAEDEATEVKLEASVAADTLALLAAVPTLRRLDLSGREDLVDRDLAFLEAMPWLTAVSFAGCSRIGDGAVAYLRNHQALEQINLKWTPTGDPAVTALAGKKELCRVLGGNHLTDAGIERLRDFPALAEARGLDSFVGVSSARTLTDLALAHIGELKGAAALDLHTSVFGSRLVIGLRRTSLSVQDLRVEQLEAAGPGAG